VRQGKVFDIELEGADRKRTEAALKDAADKLLANIVIENYRVEFGVNDAFAWPQFFRANFVRTAVIVAAFFACEACGAGEVFRGVLSGAALQPRSPQTKLAADCVSTTCGRGRTLSTLWAREPAMAENIKSARSIGIGPRDCCVVSQVARRQDHGAGFSVQTEKFRLADDLQCNCDGKLSYISSQSWPPKRAR